MYQIIKGNFLIYILLFIIIGIELDELIPKYILSILLISCYILIGYFMNERKQKIINYFFLSFIGLILLIISSIISPNFFFTKTIESSQIWILIDWFLSPLEIIRFWLKIQTSWFTYLVEILLIGILPYIGRILKLTRK